MPIVCFCPRVVAESRRFGLVRRGTKPWIGVVAVVFEFKPSTWIIGRAGCCIHSVACGSALRSLGHRILHGVGDIGKWLKLFGGT
jgi:hypothetical protein